MSTSRGNRSSWNLILLAGFAVMSLLAVSCGSTAEDTSDPASDDADSAGSGSGESAGSADDSTGDDTEDTDADAGDSDTGDSDGDGEGDEVDEEPEPVVPENGRGVTDTTITIAIPVVENTAAGSESVGAEGVGGLVQEDVALALVDAINDRGGIAGRELVPVFQRTDASVPIDPQDALRQACATYTEDNQVFAVVSIFAAGTDTLSCLADAGVAYIASSGIFVFDDDAVYDEFPLYFNSGASLSRAAAGFVTGLDASGYLAEGGTYGLLRLSSPEFDRSAEDVLLPALADAGVDLAEEVALAAIASTDDVGRLATEAQNAVLRMKDAGVDHLLVFESGGALPFFFISSAAGQDYAPAYAFTSMSGGQGLLQNVDPGDAVAVGWDPLSDVGPANDIGMWPARQECLDLIDPSGSLFDHRQQESEAVRFCDAFGLLEAALADAPGVNAEVLLAGVEALGESYASPAVNATQFGPGRHDGVANYRIARYDADCACYAYTDDPPAPLG